MSSVPVSHPPLIPGDDQGAIHRRALAREFFASALYVALVLLAALVALPRDRLPSDHAVLATLFGTALGLVLAHFVAFRFAAHFTAEAGRADTPLFQEAVAGLAGGLLVALIAAVPYVLFSGDDALLGSLIALATLPAVMGGAIARLRGRSRTQALVAAGLALVAAMVVVYVKDFLGH
ncbi:MAG: hypothetical protein MUF35_09485 [Candidatus Nanopelagicales bacterium]|jgi:hypothetical protein|nr:hypothetical protein [Candidatus Nanopelagicales bacterium]